MIDWRASLRGNNWRLIEWTALDEGDQYILYRYLRRQLRRKDFDDGLEITNDYIRIQDAKNESEKRAAFIFGELRHLYEPEPNWLLDAEKLAKQTLADAGVSPLDKDGYLKDAEAYKTNSVEWHAQLVLHHLKWFNNYANIELVNEDNPELIDNEELQTWMADSAKEAYYLGAHIRAIQGKEFEYHAMRGIKTQESASKGGQAREGKLGKHTKSVLGTMEPLIRDGHTAANAGRIAFRKGLGTTAEANRRLWGRHERKRAQTK